MKKEIRKINQSDQDKPVPSSEVTEKVNLYKELTGTSFKTLALDIVERSAFAIPGYNKEKQTKVLCELLQDIRPQNAIEGMLCAQLAVLHFQGIQCLGSAEDAQWRQHIEINLNYAIKLLRLQHETIETLVKYRRKGEQRVVVQHVNVNDGGKAIVGHFQAGGQKSEEIERGTP